MKDYQKTFLLKLFFLNYLSFDEKLKHDFEAESYILIEKYSQRNLHKILNVE